jgi:hypothetical protein
VSKQTLGTKEAEMKILDSLLKFNFFLSRRSADNLLSFFVPATRDGLGEANVTATRQGDGAFGMTCTESGFPPI